MPVHRRRALPRNRDAARGITVRMIQTAPTPSRRARPSIRFPRRGEASRSPNAARAALPGQIVIHPEEGPAEGIDVTQGVVGVIASELWRLRGGNDVLNWIEAERLLIHALLAGLDRDRETAGAAAHPT